ncbi:hypothetical protein DQ04_06561040 [Trypanosoma grayi]|uniref:hypothetical protein n=1 Tax=Trypanosoma grayi TaxID=71804 RepID=UPI0004F46734|nr:hypothetical protein DQ04_06561040 [Trypanosoma grayi]KEG08729.1 hypothetical protein DQ04_06561040 [Trypanosoma grayi]
MRCDDRTFSSTHRLYMLAAALSISPGLLLRYTAEVRRRGAYQHQRSVDEQSQQHPQPPSGTGGQFRRDSRACGSSEQAETSVTSSTELTQEFPPPLHAILCALVLPFTNLETSLPSSAAAVLKEGEAKLPAQKKDSKSKKEPPHEVLSPVSKDGKLGRTVPTNMQEHFASLKGSIASRRIKSGRPRSGSVSSTEIHDGSSADDDDGDSSTSVSSTSEVAGKGCSGIEEAAVVGPKRHSRCEDYYRGVPAEVQEVSTAKLLAELADPILAAKAHAAGSSNNNNNNSNSGNDADTKAELQQSIQLLPRELHTAAGVARLNELYPPFLPLLLEALLKECVHGDAMGLAARRVVVRLTELAAPIFVLQQTRRSSNASTSTQADMEVTLHAMTLRASQRLTTTAISLFDVIDDPVWALNLCGSLIAGQLLHPSAPRAVMCRRALDLAKMPQLWRPSVALAYALVTHHSLHAAVRAEEELRAQRRMAELLPLSDATSAVANGSAAGEPPSQMPSGGEADSSAGPSSPVAVPPSFVQPLQQQHQRNAHLQETLSSARCGSAGASAVDEAPLATGRSVASMGRAASLSSSFRTTVLLQPLFSGTDISAGGGALQWRFPDKVPPTVTMPNTIVMTCMILCAGPLSQHTVVTLGQWCLRSLSVLPATPSAVGLTHLMLKYPQFLEKATLRLSSLSQTSSSSPLAFAIGGGGGSGGSSSSHVTTPFCNAVFMEGCQIANKVMKRQTKWRSDGRLALVWQSDGELNDNVNADVSGGMGSVSDKAVLNELYEVQCYLVMMLEALVMRRGTQLSSEAQDELASLFQTVARLRVTVGLCNGTANTSERANNKDNGEGANWNMGRGEYDDRLPQLVMKLVDESFRVVARAVDVVLHDYDAGSPRRLCEGLVLLLPPHNTLFAELRRLGVWEQHLDCLETVQAAAEAFRDALRPSSARQSSSAYQKLQEQQVDMSSATTVYQGRALPRPVSLLKLQEELAVQAKRLVGTAAAATRSSAEVMFGSLIGVLPSSGEPLRLAADNGGGLTAAQRQWWVRHMVVYLVEEWWRSRVAQPARFFMWDDDDDARCGGAVGDASPTAGMRESFIECCAYPI